MILNIICYYFKTTLIYICQLRCTYSSKFLLHVHSIKLTRKKICSCNDMHTHAGSALNNYVILTSGLFRVNTCLRPVMDYRLMSTGIGVELLKAHAVFLLEPAQRPQI